MVGLKLWRSPNSKILVLPSQPLPASPLHCSASVSKFASVLNPPKLPKKPVTSRTASNKSKNFDHDAPYPLSYDRPSLACDSLDSLALKNIRKSCSWVNFAPGSTPGHCLDLGCGTGGWVLEAAGEWPECKFTGFDLVNIQPPLSCLDPQLARRIKWVHGNFLNRLPFVDGCFDHVHIRQIARGVPEDKWDHLMAEVVRVLKDTGTVELFEEDIIFPVLPRPSTATPRQLTRKRSTFLRPSANITKQHVPASLPAHDHALLETLFYRVFERRFISLYPTQFILGVLNIHLHGVGGSPLINFPLPPAPKLAPLDESRPSTPVHTPAPASVKEENGDTPLDADMLTVSRWSWQESSEEGSRSTTRMSATDLKEPDLNQRIAFLSETEAAMDSQCALLPVNGLAVTEGTLGLNLYRSWQGVLSCSEAMWEVYRDMVQHNETLLAHASWEQEELGWTDRQRFEVLLARYKFDMEALYPISDALVTELQWTKPSIALTKEEKNEFKEVVAARRDALRLERSGIGAVPEASRVCRKARFFVASKQDVYHAM